MIDPHETAPHNHEALTASVEVAKTKAAMKSQVQNARARPGQVLAAAIHGAPQEVRISMGRDETLRRTLRRCDYLSVLLVDDQCVALLVGCASSLTNPGHKIVCSDTQNVQ